MVALDSTESRADPNSGASESDQRILKGRSSARGVAAEISRTAMPQPGVRLQEGRMLVNNPCGECSGVGFVPMERDGILGTKRCGCRTPERRLHGVGFGIEH